MQAVRHTAAQRLAEVLLPCQSAAAAAAAEPLRRLAHTACLFTLSMLSHQAPL